MTRLEFGKHAGKRLSEIPTDYLRWADATLTKLSPLLRASILDELERRGASSRRPTLLLPAAVSIPTARQIVSAGRRALAKSAHPDVGGNAHAMTEVNATSDWLEQLLRSLDRDEVAS